VGKVHLEIQDAKERMDHMVPKERMETLAILGVADRKVEIITII